MSKPREPEATLAPSATRRSEAMVERATGTAALGALALGAAALGGLAIGRLRIGRARIGPLRTEELEVGRLIIRNPDGS